MVATATTDPLVVLERIHADARLLRELAGPALVITIEPAPVEADQSPPPQDSGALPRRHSRAVARENEAKVVAFLTEHGPSSQAEVMRGVGLSAHGTSGALQRLEADGGARRTGEMRSGQPGGRGRKSPVWDLVGLADDSLPEPPEPLAPASLPSRPAPAPVKTQAEKTAHVASTRRRTTETARLVSEALRDGPLSANEVAEKTGLTRARVTAVFQHARGAFRQCDFKDGKQLWERRPLPAEQEDVTIRNGGGVVTETQLVECLRHWGPLSMFGLAQELGCKASDVSLAMCPLEDQGLVVKIAGGKYQLVERAERVA